MERGGGGVSKQSSLHIFSGTVIKRKWGIIHPRNSLQGLLKDEERENRKGKNTKRKL